MHARFFRRLSHAPLLRTCALLAWLAMVSVPVAASARACMHPAPDHAAVVHAPAPAHAGGCCQGHAGEMSSSTCEACAASAGGLVVPVDFAMTPVGFTAPAWPVRSPVLRMRFSAPPLRPPRS